MAKNGNIRSYFQPVSRSSQGSSPPQASAAVAAAGPARVVRPASLSPSPLPSPFPLSSPAPPRSKPGTPQAPVVVLSRDAIIPPSDDDDDDSDDSLPDIIPRKLSTSYAAAPARHPDPCVTPHAKRTALEFHSSPLSIRQPKHKYDLKALLSHAEKDDAAQAAADEAAAALLAAHDDSPKPKRVVVAGGTASSPRTEAIDMAADDHDGELDRDKVKRALQRTELHAVREVWYFFKEYVRPSRPSLRDAFPDDAAAATGRWAFLANADTRDDFFEQGLVDQALRSGTTATSPTATTDSLPDEIFLWILNEVPLQPADSLREQYITALALCPAQIRRLVDDDQVCELFQRLDSRWESTELSDRLSLVPAVHDPYPDRDWSRLRSVLSLLAQMGGEMNIQAATCTAKILLRLGIDSVVAETIDLLLEYQKAMESVVSSVPRSEWNRFCEDVCASLCDSIRKPSLRWQSLGCLPTASPRAHELRRRLVAVCFFDNSQTAKKEKKKEDDDDNEEEQEEEENGIDASLAGQNPERCFTIPALIERLRASEFSISPRTDYYDLGARIKFLDVLIDDAGRHLLPSPDAEKQFNAKVDDLVLQLKAILRKIPNAGASQVSRLATKTVLEILQDRLTYSVRTRRPPKVSIFDRIAIKDNDDDNDGDKASLPKQQEMMRNFFTKKPKPVA